ncbi:HNH/endonuclease VII fold toxin-2 domain-containing protein [Pseudomonas paralcaligenes]|uniref:HNH/endonuclease VII fold toxin-2 domain-containing protein n=1 Tax=Pseudomonas paralcaligenes TaxID=2772558 RepID=UPI001C81D973|nr:HNH/endonuclease VII fold toxin-2 domain-containing protein [Pseudomonas paralcaligenes]
MRTIPNTPTHIYFDSAAVKQHCDKDFRAISRACKPESESSNKKKTKGVAGKIAGLTEKLDKLGKKAAGYGVRTASNAWMDDHCSGLWLKPKEKYDQSQLDALKDAIENLDVGIFSKLKLLLGSLDEMFELAYELLPESVVREIAEDFAKKAAIKGILAVIGSESIVIPVAMALWAIYDIMETARILAEVMGDKGKQALEAILRIKDLGDKVEEFLKDLIEKPAKAHTNMMSLLALMDSCLRARKCLLVPYSQQNSISGQGCCPGQTGHHLIPNSAATGSCTSYDNNSAPVMCLEGTKNNEGWGTHGNAHIKLKDLIRIYRNERSKSGKSPNIISLDDMASNAVDAVRLSGAALQCDRDCLLAQLKAYYNCPNGMLPKDGTGVMSKMPEPTPPTETPDI